MCDAQDSNILQHSVKRWNCSSFAIFISSRSAYLWFLFPPAGRLQFEFGTCHLLFFLMPLNFILFLWTGDKHFIFQTAQDNLCYELLCSFQKPLSLAFVSLFFSIIVWWLLCDDRASAQCSHFSSRLVGSSRY